MKRCIPIFFLFYWFSLQSQRPPDFRPGTITPAVRCIADTTQAYALFLPSAYSEERRWPVIFFFEPAARARLPLTKYHRMAELYGYILVCSYNSKNGPNEPIFRAANAMYADVFERFSPDKDRVCLAGFSGGARISCLIAMENPDIQSVIGCGAGFPYSTLPEKSPSFDYCGIIGQQDMNYQEMVNLDSALNAFPMHNMLITFPKGHQWPDSASFHNAFYWLETNAVRKGHKQKDSSFIQTIHDDYLNRLRAPDNSYQCAHRMKNLLLLLSDLLALPEIEEAYDSVLRSPAYQRNKSEVDSIRSFELQSQKRYIAEFEQISLLGIDPDHPVKGETWWKSEFRKIDALKDTNLRARLQEFLINGSWEQHYNSLRLNRYGVALGYLNVYKAGLPDNPSPPYLMAKVHARAGDRKAMYECLEEAIQKGLSDPEKLIHEPVFIPYKKQSKFQKTILKIQ